MRLRKTYFRSTTVALLLLAGSTLLAQMTTTESGASSYSTSETSASPSVTGVGSLNQNPFTGSVTEGKVSPEVLPLSFKDAIDRGLRNNLGMLLQSDSIIAARGQRWKELSDLLPNLSAGVSETAAQQNLAALGFRASANSPLAKIPLVVGPFGYFDARAYLSQSLFNLKSIDRERGAAANVQAARYSYKDARDTVVLAVGNAYLQAIAGAARVDTAQAQVQTAQALYERTADQQKVGVSPAIDALRAHVELQTRQQQLIVARNDYAKQKLALARAIGLPTGQEFTLTEKVPYEPLAALGIEDSLQRAYASRSDYQAALQQVRAAEHFRNAATAEHFPSLGLNANYGDLGVSPGNSHGTFQVTGSLTIPIFPGGKIHADVLQAEATLRQNREHLEDLRGRIEYDVRTALLDLAAANEQVHVAQSSVDLANQTLLQARDRFTAGVADNLEVVQAQESVASANENYISSLYAHNLAKVALARAIGYAEEGVKKYLQSK